ncbi:acetamidase [Thermogymnomonas acidicola]|uniref:Acetamidase n=1 Tax=Thermogymnomonas acidicola TaxID=399579 RepID=A0AA37BRG8_9ARCH|nr:acetamidase/formamidase family protein [Thermogymnomonas acidicola]GGM74112.1 acetamidase [Thermogymnomonas acidicola]
MKRIGWKGNFHTRWAPDLDPVATIENGETFEVEIPDSSTGQAFPGMSPEDMATMDQSILDAAVGPFLVEGASPGDAICVEILDIKTADWGWTAIIRDFGLLKNRFEEAVLTWDIGESAVARGALSGIRVQVEPFLGIIGVAPASGEFPMIPPQAFGGNMDNRLNCTGSKVYLPVFRPGALLSLGDPHAAQGDGEVCGTAIETSARVRLRVSVVKGMAISSPLTVSPQRRQEAYVCTTGIGGDLHRAAQDAVLSMIGLISSSGIPGPEAYMLCSVAGNLRVSEIVDEPNYVVSMCMPSGIMGSILPGGGEGAD